MGSARDPRRADRSLRRRAACPVGADITTRNVFLQAGRLKTNTGTALMLYRELDARNQFADFGGGFRPWGFSTNLSLNIPGLHAGGRVKRSAGWDWSAARRTLSLRFGVGEQPNGKTRSSPVVLIYTGAVFWIIRGKLGKVQRSAMLEIDDRISAEKAM
jgi:hypothetical protein